MTTVIQNGTLVFADRCKKADIQIEGETIRAIGPDLQGDRVIDATGCLVFPGFIDGHTHLDMPVSGTVTSDDFASGSTAALAGGTTMLIDFATQDKGDTLAHALEIWHSRADGNCSCDYGFHMAVTDWNAHTRAELHEMAAAGITSFKCYYAYDALMLSDPEMYDILCEMKQIGGVLGVHCENGPVLNQLREKALAEGHTDPSWHPKTRPALVEGEAVSRFLRIAALADVPAWIVHLSTEDGRREIALARARGQKVWVETCPQYLFLDESVYEKPDFEAAKYVCSPPLRSKADQQSLWEAVQQGEIDIVSTDHCSFHFHGQKEMGRSDFTQIPNGMPGIEHRPVVMYTAGVATGKITVSDLCRILAENPAKMFGLYPKKGALAVGSDADLVIFDPTKKTTISAKTQYQNCDYTPYEGFQTAGCVRDVFLRGTYAVQNGKVVENGLGRYIKREQSR
ncbi:MAG: dihydropyrimidinase [Butyricicoccus sp.]|nr:dihydropyrimidinase [Butyricicoccus sp.]